MKKITAMILMVLLCFSLVGCFGGEEIQGIDISDSVLASHESTILITTRESYDDEEATTFKPSISAKDITLSEALKGKTVKSVKFIDENNIEVVLDGVSTAMTAEEGFGKLKISKNALEGKNDVFDMVIVEKAYIAVRSMMSSSATGTYQATFYLAAGSFTDKATKENVTLLEGCDGTIEEVKVENGELSVSITGATRLPAIVIKPEATTFSKEITMIIDKFSKVTVE